MHLARKDCPVARLPDPAELLHDRRRQADLVSSDGTSAGRLLDLLKRAPDRISLLEACRINLRGQDLCRPAASEQLDYTFGLLPRVEKGHSRLSALLTTQAQRAQRNNIYDSNISEPSIVSRIKTLRLQPEPLLRIALTTSVFAKSSPLYRSGSPRACAIA